MSEENILGGRVEVVDVGLPFTPELNEPYDTTPMYRIVLDVSGSSSLGYLERGYFIKLNYGVYFIRKQIISIYTNSQAERVFQFLKKTNAEFVISINHDKTLSGHQYIQLNDISVDKGIYTVRDYQVFKSLWQVVEGELYENNYSPSIVRFTDNRLIWHVKLLPEHSLTFSDAGKLRLNFVGSQGHLEVYKISYDNQFTLPNYLYTQRETTRMFNHEIKAKHYVIPLGVERKIIDVSSETVITSTDHEPIKLESGQYLLWHPKPKDRVD